MRARVDEAALRTVITYKWVKGAVQLLLFAALLTTFALGLDDDLGRWAHEFRNHSTRAYAVLLGRALERATTPRGMHITLLALLVDGDRRPRIEGWALQRRHAWGPWLVVGVSGVAASVRGLRALPPLPTDPAAGPGGERRGGRLPRHARTGAGAGIRGRGLVSRRRPGE